MSKPFSTEMALEALKQVEGIYDNEAGMEKILEDAKKVYDFLMGESKHFEKERNNSGVVCQEICCGCEKCRNRRF